MTPQVFWRLLKQHLLWFILLPCVTAGIAWYVTRNEIKIYRTKATLYTGITSGYSIRSASDGYHIDHTAVSNAFDNILTTLHSQESQYQVGVRLLSDHLLAGGLNPPLSATVETALQKALPADLRRSLAESGNVDVVRSRVDSLGRSAEANPVRKLLIQSDSYYSLNTIGKKLKSARRNSSDMLDLEYESDDPTVARQTLTLAIDVLNERYTALKKSETNPVVSYYEDKVKKARQRLDATEAQIRQFDVKHNVLNFDEELKNKTINRDALANEYNQELMRNGAAKAAMDAINRRLGERGKLLKISTELTDKQAELTAVETQIINARTNNAPQVQLNRLQERLRQVSEELKAIARTYYAADNSSDVVPQLTLINEWLGKVLAYEESSAKLAVFKKQLDAYQTESATLSPLASQIRQLNRDLKVNEQEYLDLVKALNQANTQRQDIAVDGRLRLLDAPLMPYKPLDSKRMLLVALGAAVGLFLALLLTAIRFLLDRRIQSPEGAESTIGLPVTALFPKVKKFTINSRSNRLAVSMFEQLGNAINIENAQNNGLGRPALITLFSIRSGQGKTWVAHGLARLYAGADQKVAYYYPRKSETDARFEQEGLHFFPYDVTPDFMNVKELGDLLDEEYALMAPSFEKHILELPPIISSPIPVFLVNRSVVSVLVADANSAWRRTEKQLLAMYRKLSTHPLLLILNRVADDYTDAPSVADVGPGATSAKRFSEPNLIE